MTKKKTAANVTYEVLIHCCNDKKGTSFEAGDTVKNSDFKPAVIKNWLEIGVLKVVK